MKTTAEAILKEAYFLELRGQALYQNAMKADMSSELKDLFAFFAKEETAHADLLKEQLKKVKKGEPLHLSVEPPAPSLERFSVKDIAATVDAAGYEGALLGAALDFERRAFEFYQKQAEAKIEPNARKLYSELAEWEKSHMVLFAELDREIREKVWYDNNFWPLD